MRKRTMRHHLIPLLLFLLLTAIAQPRSPLVFSHPIPQTDLRPPSASSQTELQTEHQRPLPSPQIKRRSQTEELPDPDAKVPIEDPAATLPDDSVLTWNDQILEWDDLTLCIRDSKAGNAVERWLDCLESLEQGPAAAAHNLGSPLSLLLKPSQSLHPRGHDESVEPHQLGFSNGDAREGDSPESSEGSIRVLDPLSGAGSSHEGFISAATAAAGSCKAANPTAESSDERSQSDTLQCFEASTETENQSPGADSRAPEEEADGATARSAHGNFLDTTQDSKRSHCGDSYVDIGLPVKDGSGRAIFVLESESAGLRADSLQLQSSVSNENGGAGAADAAKSLTSTKAMLNVSDALKVAACLGAVLALIWRKRDRLGAQEPLLSEEVEEYPRPSALAFSVAGCSSSNRDVGYPNVKAGSLPAPLGMAIATVMAEVLGHEHSQQELRSADELSMLLEAAMTESLSPVMGGECTGFVEQFKQSFRSTYRLIGSVRNVSSARKLPRPSFTKIRSPRYHRRPPPGRNFRRAADDDDDDDDEYNTGLSDFSRGGQSDGGLAADPQLDLAEQFSKLTFSAQNSGPEAESSRYTDRGESSSHVEQEIFGELGDACSNLRRDVSDGLSARGRVGSQSAQKTGAQSVSSQTNRHQPRSLQPGSFGLDLAMQPFARPEGQLVTAAKVEDEDEDMAVLSSSGRHGGAHLQHEMLHVLKQQNYLKSVELSYKFRGLSMKELNLHLTSESNSLMRESVGLSRSKVELREAELQDRRLATAHADLVRRCADELVAGLCVMLCALCFGGWKYSYARLVDVVSSCQPSLYEASNSMIPGVNRVVNSLNLLTSRLQMFVCEVTVASRMLLGLGVVAVVAAALLRKSVTSGSQAMPATILVVVLGGVCGAAGKFAVDAMGGSGYRWLLAWEAWCLVHALATCFTSALYWLLNGAPEGAAPSAARKGGGRRHHLVSPWLRRLAFHATMVLVLPAMAGLLPFAPAREVACALGASARSLVLSPVEAYVRDKLRFSLL